MQPDLATSVRLKLAVFESRGDFMPCGADFFQDHDVNVTNALQVFPEIQKNTRLLQILAGHLNVNPSALGNDERVLIYCEYKRIESIRLEPHGDQYRVINADSKEPSQGWTSVDLGGRVMSFGWGTLYPATSPRLRDIKPAPAPTPKPISIHEVDHLELRSRLLDRFPDESRCDSRFQERQQEIESFPKIAKDAGLFSEILRRLHLSPQNEFSDTQKLAVYREYARLKSITLELLVNKYQYRRMRYIGLIDGTGDILVSRILPPSGCPRI